MVLGQKAYILFYIKSPTNGHSMPAQAKPGRAAANGPAEKGQAAPLKGQQASHAEASHLQQAPAKAQSLANASRMADKAIASASGNASKADKPTVPANGKATKADRPSVPANGKASKSNAPVFGPAERPRTGLAAAVELCEQLLAPVAGSNTHQQQQAAQAQPKADAVIAAANAAAGVPEAMQATHQAQGVKSDEQQKSEPQHLQGMPSRSSQQAQTQPRSLPSQTAKPASADSSRTDSKASSKKKSDVLGNSSTAVKASRKRKSDVLGSSNARPSVLKRMNAAALRSAEDEAVDKSKKGKKSAKASPENGIESVVRADAPGNATQSSRAPEAIAEEGRQQLPSSSRPADEHPSR